MRFTKLNMMSDQIISAIGDFHAIAMRIYWSYSCRAMTLPIRHAGVNGYVGVNERV